MQPDTRAPFARDLSAPAFFAGLVFTLRLAEIAYAAYLAGGKTLLHARVLRRYNDALRTQIAMHTHHVPPSLTEEFCALVLHLDIWSASWDALYDSRPFNNDEPFVFETIVGFPRAQVLQIIAYSNGADTDLTPQSADRVHP